MPSFKIIDLSKAEEYIEVWDGRTKQKTLTVDFVTYKVYNSILKKVSRDYLSY